MLVTPFIHLGHGLHRLAPGRRFQAWPEDALEAVATKFLGNLDAPSDTRKVLKVLGCSPIIVTALKP